MRVFIDVREPEEFASGHVEGAINIPLARLMQGSPLLKDIPKDAEIVLYCRTGNRSKSSMPFFNALGFKNLINGINKDQVSAKYL